MKKQLLLSFIFLALVGAQNIAAAEEGGMWQSAKNTMTSDTAKNLVAGTVITSVLALGTKYAVKYVQEKSSNKYLNKITPKQAAMAVLALGAIITGAKVWRLNPENTKDKAPENHENNENSKDSKTTEDAESEVEESEVEGFGDEEFEDK